MTKPTAVGGPPPVDAPLGTLSDEARVLISRGAALATDIHLPSHVPTGGLPAIVLRTPYGRRGPIDRIEQLAPALTAAGFAFITQDVRGSFDSSGAATPFVHEASDGALTLDWVTSQRWSNGLVIPYGDSYAGYTAWTAAQSENRGLLGLVARVTTTCIADEWFHRDGAFRLQLALPWLDFAFGRRLLDHTPPAWVPGQTATEAQVLPPDLKSGWLDRRLNDPFWDNHSLRGPFVSRAVRVPALHWTAWWDLLNRGQLRDYRARVQAGHRHDRLVIDSSDHEFHALYDRESSSDHVGRLATEIRQFHDALIGGHSGRGNHISIARATPKTAPLPVRTAILYLRDSEHARIGPEGGGLDAVPDVLPTPAIWIDDPADPVSSLERWIWGPLHDGLPDERATHIRPDVLTFTQAEQRQPLTLLGTVRLNAPVRATHRATHLVATLCDVRPDGRASRMCDGVTVLRPAPRWQQVQIELGAIGYQIQTGHRLRLSLAATAFPRYPPAVPTTAQWWTNPLPEPQELGIRLGPHSFLELIPDPALDQYREAARRPISGKPDHR